MEEGIDQLPEAPVEGRGRGVGPVNLFAAAWHHMPSLSHEDMVQMMYGSQQSELVALRFTHDICVFLIPSHLAFGQPQLTNWQNQGGRTTIQTK